MQESFGIVCHMLYVLATPMTVGNDSNKDLLSPMRFSISSRYFRDFQCMHKSFKVFLALKQISRRIQNVSGSSNLTLKIPAFRAFHIFSVESNTGEKGATNASIFDIFKLAYDA